MVVKMNAKHGMVKVCLPVLVAMAAPPLDVTKFTERERKAARKDLMKKIEHYNKQTKKTREAHFPISSPTKVRGFVRTGRIQNGSVGV